MLYNHAGLKTPEDAGLQAQLMPNVVGMGLKDAVYLLENKGLKISFMGRGKVISQSATAGTNISKGQKISLMLN